jgi:porin
MFLKERFSSVLAKAGFLAGAALLAAVSAPVQADDIGPTLVVTGEYALDLVSVAHGPRKGTRHVDLLAITAEIDLERAAGWSGARLLTQGIAGTGGEPNLLAGTLQGIDNNEVTDNRVKLYQFYLEQRLAQLPVMLRAGFIDLNEDFYANDAAGLLMAPAFGVGSELAATGPNGPSIFPSTAPTATIRVEPSEASYGQFAVVSAETGVPGDRGGVPSLFSEGALLVGEAGITSFGKLALGAWSYTRRQDDLRLTGDAGDPLARRARGAYVLFDIALIKGDAVEADAPDKATFFLRAGISDGNTAPFKGGWQAGVLINRVFAGRPDSQLSIGANQAFLSRKYRLNESDAGNPQRKAESAIELTYSDQLAPWLTVQPDVQYVWNSSRAPGFRDAFVLGLRFTFARTLEW